jgi:PAS domain S-box-containing protein
MDEVYRIILDHGLAGIWDQDLKNNTIYFSPSFKAMFGYNDDEIENTLENWQKIIFAEDIPKINELLSAHIAKRTGDPFHITSRYRHKNGSVVWIDCTGMITEWDDNWQPLRIVGCHVDITKQKEIEEKLKKTKDLLNKTNLSVRLGGWEIDLTSGKMAWTRVTKQIHEVPLDYEAHLQTRLNFYKEGEHRQRVTAIVNRAIETGEGYDMEAILVTTSGKELWVRIIGNTEFENGRCVKLFGTIQDIDEDKRIKLELQRSEERFKGAFENSTIGMAMVSPEGKWLKVNRQLIDCLGYSAEELNGKTFQDITHPDDLQADLDLVAQVLAGEIQNYQMEKRFFHKNGDIIWVLLSVSLVRNNDGVPLHFVSHVQDITDKKQKEEQIKETLDVVSQQNNRLLNFAYIVSHNLRTHSGNFQSLINLVNDPHTDAEERVHYLQLLQDVSGQLNETILNLNDVVSIQSNMHLQKVQVNLSSYINKTINVLTGEITRHNAIINNMVDDGVEIDYHPAYLESILLNFLTNSIRYRSKTRSPEVCINYAHNGKGGILTISDNGVGIDMKKHGQNLFGMYKTFHGNSDAKGVGLFITKNQVEAMGGKIEVQSHVDRGTTFEVHL